MYASKRFSDLELTRNDISNLIYKKYLDKTAKNQKCQKNQKNEKNTENFLKKFCSQL